MPATPPTLTDRAALGRIRARARNDGLFLHDLAAERLEETLAAVNRTFTAPAIVTGNTQVWSRRFPDATIVPDSAVLDLAPGGQDLVIHAMALHWADDPVGQLIQARRALKPDGLFLATFPGGRTLFELRAALATAESRIRGGLSPRIAPMMELRDAGALLQRAGLALAVADLDRYIVTYRDAFALMSDLRLMGERNALSARDRRIAPRRLFHEAAGLYAAEYPAADEPGRIRATFELLHLSGWAPDDSQPKPLRPGSASARLADALGSTEHGLRDDLRPGRD